MRPRARHIATSQARHSPRDEDSGVPDHEVTQPLQTSAPTTPQDAPRPQAAPTVAVVPVRRTVAVVDATRGPGRRRGTHPNGATTQLVRSRHHLVMVAAVLAATPGGPPGAIVVVQRASDRSVHAAGVEQVGSNARSSIVTGASPACRRRSTARPPSLWAANVFCHSTTPSETGCPATLGVGNRHPGSAPRPHEWAP